jgi:hypothetical protein
MNKDFLSFFKNLSLAMTLALTLALGLIVSKTVSAGTLLCAVRNSACNADEAEIFRMSGTVNAHAQLPSAATYSNLVCCGGVPNISNSCSGIYAVALQLSSASNAHVQQSGGYAEKACISVPTGGSISVGYAADCLASGYDTTLASMKSNTNSHVGDPDAYPTKVCVTSVAPTVSISISDGTIDYGYVDLNSTGTNTSDVQVITVSTGPANLDIRITNFTQGANTWALGAVNGADQVKFEFSKDNSTYSTFNAADTLYSFDTSVPASSNRNLYLRLTTPITTSSYSQFSAAITVVASAP